MKIKLFVRDFLSLSLLMTFILIGLKVVLAASPYRGYYYEKKCIDPQTNRELYIGETFSRPGQCVYLQCLGNLQLWEDKCEIPSLTGNCSEVPPANEFLDYPKCCPRYVCKLYEVTANGEAEETTTYDHQGMVLRKSITHKMNVPSLSSNVFDIGSGRRLDTYMLSNRTHAETH